MREIGGGSGRDTILRLILKRTWIQSAAVLGVLGLTLSFCGSKSNEPKPVLIQQIWFTPAWSPGGREIACVVDRFSDSGYVGPYLAILDSETGIVRRERQIHGQAPSAFSWTPDGEWLLFRSTSGIFKISSDLDSIVQLSTGEGHDTPSVSRSRNLVFFSVNGGSETGLWSVTLSGDSLRKWSSPETIVIRPFAFADSSDSIIALDLDGPTDNVVLFDPDHIEQAAKIGIELGWPGMVRISPDRRYVAYNDRIENAPTPTIGLFLFDRLNNRSDTLTTSMTEELDFSPDGRKVIYPRIDDVPGLWIFDLESGTHTRLTGQENETKLKF